MDEHGAAHDDRSAADRAPAGSQDLSPFELELDVAVSRTRAWDAYVHGLGEWWHPGWTAFGSGLDHIVVEPHRGGRIVEHSRDGREHEWGEVLAAVPGERFEHTLRVSPDAEPTRISVEFVDLPQGGTRVSLTHGGWTPSSLRFRAKHEEWPALLARYRAHAQHI
jgi:hypothetical protein